MRKMEVYPLAKVASLEPMEMKEAFGTYKLVARKANEDTTFIPGQAADITIIKKTTGICLHWKQNSFQVISASPTPPHTPIVVDKDGKIEYIWEGDSFVIGQVGVLHPKVLQNFGVDFPASVVEFNIEPFLG
jgi:phenylalanyl-tRNA synthetase beta subunit